MSSVRFASGHDVDMERGVVLFTAFHDHRLIPCAITVKTLLDQFGADTTSLEATFFRDRYLIERLAEELILEGRLEDDGSILIGSPDCQWLYDVSHSPIKRMSVHPCKPTPFAMTET